MDNTSSGAGAVTLGKDNTASHTDAVVIGQGASSSAADQITLGHTDQTVRISSAYTLPTADGSANYVLTTNGSGVASWAAASGGGGGDPDLYRDNASSAVTPTASGTNAVALGSGAVASGALSFAFGSSGSNAAIASGSQSISMGSYSRAYGSSSIGVGYAAEASSGASGGVALGQNARSAGNRAVALANSRASGAESFASAIGNNSSSYGATGPNSIAIGSQAKATAADAVAIGDRNEASGNGSVALAARSTASGANSVSIGFLSDATGPSSVALGSGYAGSGPQATFYNSIAIGAGSLSDKIGKVAISGHKFSSSGDGQHGIFVLRVETTNATPAPLITGPDYYGSHTPDDENQIILPNNSAYAFHGTIVARQQAADGTACAAWKVEGLIRREGSAGTTVLVNSATTVLDNTPNWGMALSADTTNGGLAITVTGAATDIRWVATIHTSEVIYA